MKLRNKSDHELKSIQINAIFRRVGETGDVGRVFRLGDSTQRAAAAPAPKPRRW